MSIFNGAGYLKNDDRCSGGKVTESDMLGCNHCQALMPKTDWKSGAGAYCPSCDSPICMLCATRMRTEGCVPFLRRFTASLEDAYRREQNRKIMGI